MKVVADSNIIFSSLISGKEVYIDTFRMNEIYVPDVVLLELDKYEKRLIQKTQMNQTEFIKFIQMLFKEITVIPKFAISKENWYEAYRLCKDTDEKDTPFVALSLELAVPLWTNDKKLVKGLKKKGFDSLLTTEELMIDLLK
jgi:predicted nucleic acid-binding protein